MATNEKIKVRSTLLQPVNKFHAFAEHESSSPQVLLPSINWNINSKYWINKCDRRQNFFVHIDWFLSAAGIRLA
jgi:hypothetical protein